MNKGTAELITELLKCNTGLPFTLVLLGACYAIIRGLMNEPR